MNDIPEKSPARVIFISIGVNDTVLGKNNSPLFFEVWEATYREAIARAQSLAGNNVAIATIIPVESGKPLGDQYFDPNRISSLNKIIRRISIDTGVRLVDHETEFRKLTASNTEYTVDGVHPDLSGYELLSKNLKSLKW